MAAGVCSASADISTSSANFNDNDDEDDFSRGDVCQLAQLWLPLVAGGGGSIALDIGDAHALLSGNSISLACIAEQVRFYLF